MDTRYVIADSAKGDHPCRFILEAFSEGFQSPILSPDKVSLTPQHTLVTFGVTCPENRALIKAHKGPWLNVDRPWIPQGDTEMGRFTLNGLYPEMPVRPLPASGGPLLSREGYLLILPPTETVAAFAGVDVPTWIERLRSRSGGREIVIRKHPSEDKNYKSLPLVEEHVNGAAAVAGFNSAILINECVKLSVPVVGDPRGSIVGSFRPFEPARARVIGPQEAALLEAHHRKCQATLEQIATVGFVDEALDYQRRARLKQIVGRAQAER